MIEEEGIEKREVGWGSEGWNKGSGRRDGSEVKGSGRR